MENQENESKKELDQTNVPTDSTEETKVSSQEEDVSSQKTNEDGGEVEEKKITVSEKEFERISKKANDFDSSIKLQRLLKISKKVKPDIASAEDSNNEYDQQLDEEDIIEKARQAAKEEANNVLLATQKGEFEKNLPVAYDLWIKENKWADNDDIMQEVGKFFNPNGSAKTEDLVDAFDRAASSAYPRAYKESLESRIRAKVLADSANISIGDVAGTSVPNNSIEDSYTKEDLDIANKFFAGDVKRYLKFKKSEEKK